MASDVNTATGKKPKSNVLGRSALTGRYVYEPVAAKKGTTVSDKQIAAAVKSVFATKK